MGNPLSSNWVCKSQGESSQLCKYMLLSTVSIVSLQVKIRQRGEQNILSFSKIIKKNEVSETHHMFNSSKMSLGSEYRLKTPKEIVLCMAGVSF